MVVFHSYVSLPEGTQKTCFALPLFMAQLAQLSIFPKGHGPRIYAPLMKLDALRKEQQMECSVTNEQVTIWAGLILRGFTLW